MRIGHSPLLPHPFLFQCRQLESSLQGINQIFESFFVGVGVFFVGVFFFLRRDGLPFSFLSSRKQGMTRCFNLSCPKRSPPPGSPCHSPPPFSCSVSRVLLPGVDRCFFQECPASPGPLICNFLVRQAIPSFTHKPFSSIM